jgi:hypothetical protein
MEGIIAAETGRSWNKSMVTDIVSRRCLSWVYDNGTLLYIAVVEGFAVYRMHAVTDIKAATFHCL